MELDRLESRLRNAFAAAQVWAVEQGATFRVATEREIRGPVLENAKRLLPLREPTLDAAMAIRVMTAMTSPRTTTIRALLALWPKDRRAVLTVIWRLIARRALRVDLSKPIAMDSRITLP